jgi:hypothetical protein
MKNVTTLNWHGVYLTTDLEEAIRGWILLLEYQSTMSHISMQLFCFSVQIRIQTFQHIFFRSKERGCGLT